jgi:hypothetical protein
MMEAMKAKAGEPCRRQPENFKATPLNTVEVVCVVTLVLLED